MARLRMVWRRAGIWLGWVVRRGRGGGVRGVGGGGGVWVGGGGGGGGGGEGEGGGVGEGVGIGPVVRAGERCCPQPIPPVLPLLLRCFQLIAQRHQFIHFGDDAMLL